MKKCTHVYIIYSKNVIKKEWKREFENPYLFTGYVPHSSNDQLG